MTIVQNNATAGLAAVQLRSTLCKLFAYAVKPGYIDNNSMNDDPRRVAGYNPCPTGSRADG